MAKLVITDFPLSLETLKPNNYPQRRYSTGNTTINEQKPIPNYLRSSTGSCHDICKYGTRRDQQIIPKQDKTSKNSETNCREKKISDNKTSVQHLSSTSNQSQVKNPNKISSIKSTKSTVRNDACKGKKSSPLTTSTVRVLSGNDRKSKSSFGIEKSSESFEENRGENVSKKIIHVIESNDRNPNRDQSQQKKKKSYANGSSLRKVKVKREKVLDVENGEMSSKVRSLRRVASQSGVDNMENVDIKDDLHHQMIKEKKGNVDLMNAEIEETSGKLVKMNQSKVKALVDAFETVISCEDSDVSLRACARSA